MRTHMGMTVVGLWSLVSFASISANAKVLQILHTNDLHAALKTSGAAENEDPEFGGWAQIKTIMDQLADQAKAQGIETLRLDAGDFFEGTLDYFPDMGVNVLKTYQAMGYDASSLGNHDWLMGAQNMDVAFGKAPFNFPLLSANTEIASWLKNLNRTIQPTAQIIKDGIKIGIVGLSTDEIFYKWITKVDSYKNDMKIADYRDFKDPQSPEPIQGIANYEAEQLRKNNDLVIALTHIGFKEDKALAQSSKDIDLIVGGHSHTLLESMSIQENRNGETVPVVQTGATGKYVGKILVEVLPGQKPKVLTYELVRVPHDAPADAKVMAAVNESEKRVVEFYGKDKLDRKLGTSATRLVSGSGGATPYSRFVVDAMKDTTGADLAIDLGEFHSNSPQSGGDVTMRKLMEMYPRKLNVEQNEGLYVYTFKTPGWALKIALNLATKFGYELSMSGIDMDTYQVSDDQLKAEKEAYGDTWKAAALSNERVKAISINGQPLKLLKHYRIAIPEFGVRGAYAISWITRLVMRWGRPTPYTIWDASAKYLEKVGSITGGIRKFKPQNQKSGEEYPYGQELVNEVLKELQSAPEALSTLKERE